MVRKQQQQRPAAGVSMTIRAVESRSRALIVVLDCVHTDGGSNNTMSPSSSRTRTRTRRQDLLPPPPPRAATVVVANVHWEAGMGPDHDATRFYQVQSLMKRIDHHCRQAVRQPGGAEGTMPMKLTTAKTILPEPGIVVIGDWNMLPDSPLYRFVSTGRVESNDDRPFGVRSASSPPLPPPLLPPLVRLPVPRLPLRDAFAAQQRRASPAAAARTGGGTPRACGATYAGGAVLDYAFVSDNVRVRSAHAQPVPPLTSGDDRRRRPPSLSGGRRRYPRHRWPNLHHPSDHLAIGATLRLESTSE
jgi:endonuclease/exonuclease/phosphatase family metal-dependent hydrolase